MNQREKLLAAAVLLLVVALVGKSLYGKYQDALETRQDAMAETEKRLTTANRRVALGRKAVRRMQEWQARSLPADREKALTLYKAWLLEKAKEAGLEVSDIDPSMSPSASTAYAAVGYKLKATGSLEAVVAMMYEFYRSPMLQQVTRLQLNRPQGATQLDVQLDVEALSLPRADAIDELPKGNSNRLRLAGLDEYKKTFSERDLVNVYTPPRPPRPVAERRETPKPPAFDDAEQAFFSGTTGTIGSLQAWVNIRTTGETKHLAAGDELEVGALKGKVVSVEQRSLVFETDGKKYRVALGESLRKGKEIGGDSSAASEKPEQTPES
jgi:hypothetical protein